MTRFHMAPESEARFRAVTHTTLHVSHVRQKCACGKQTTAKALTQYGKCVACQHGVTAAEISSMRSKLKTMITGDVVPAPSTWTKAREA